MAAKKEKAGQNVRFGPSSDRHALFRSFVIPQSLKHRLIQRSVLPWHPLDNAHQVRPDPDSVFVAFRDNREGANGFVRFEYTAISCFRHSGRHITLINEVVALVLAENDACSRAFLLIATHNKIIIEKALEFDPFFCPLTHVV